MNSAVFAANFGDEITAMCHDSSYQTWCVGTMNGLIYQLNSSFETQMRVQDCFGSVTSLMIPSYGGLMSAFRDGTIKHFSMDRDSKERRLIPIWMTKVEAGYVPKFTTKMVGKSVSCLAELPGGRVAVGMDNGILHVLDKKTGKALVCKGHMDKISAVISLGEGFASGSSSRICVWSADGELESVLDMSGSTLLLSPCGRYVAAGVGNFVNLLTSFEPPDLGHSVGLEG